MGDYSPDGVPRLRFIERCHPFGRPRRAIFEEVDEELISDNPRSIFYVPRKTEPILHVNFLNKRELENSFNPYANIPAVEHINVIKAAAKKTFYKTQISVKREGVFDIDPRRPVRTSTIRASYMAESGLPKEMEKAMEHNAVSRIERDLNNARDTMVTPDFSIIGNDRGRDEVLQEALAEHANKTNFFNFWSCTNLRVCSDMGKVITENDTSDPSLVGWMVLFPPVQMETDILVTSFNRKNYSVYSTLPLDRKMDDQDAVYEQEKKITFPYIGPVNFGVAVPTPAATNLDKNIERFSSHDEVAKSTTFYHHKFIMRIKTGQYLACNKEILEFAYLRVLLFNMGRHIPRGDMRRHVIIHGMRLPFCPVELLQWTKDNESMIEREWMQKDERQKEKDERKKAYLEKMKERQKLLGIVDEEAGLVNKYKRNGNLVDMFNSINSQNSSQSQSRDVSTNMKPVQIDSCESKNEDGSSKAQKRPRTSMSADEKSMSAPMQFPKNMAIEEKYKIVSSAIANKTIDKLVVANSEAAKIIGDPSFYAWTRKRDGVVSEDDEYTKDVDDSSSDSDYNDDNDLGDDHEDNDDDSDDLNTDDEIVQKDIDACNRQVEEKKKKLLKKMEKARRELSEDAGENEDMMNQVIDTEVNGADESIPKRKVKKSIKSHKAVGSGNKSVGKPRKRESTGYSSEVEDEEDRMVGEGSVVDLASRAVKEKVSEEEDSDDEKNDKEEKNDEEEESGDSDNDMRETKRAKTMEPSKAGSAAEKKKKSVPRRTRAEIQEAAARKRAEKERLALQRKIEREKNKSSNQKKDAKDSGGRKKEDTPNKPRTEKKSSAIASLLVDDLANLHVKTLADAIEKDEKFVIQNAGKLRSKLESECKASLEQANAGKYKSEISEEEKKRLRNAVLLTLLMVRDKNCNVDLSCIKELFCDRAETIRCAKLVSFEAVGDIWGMKSTKDVSDTMDETVDDAW